MLNNTKIKSFQLSIETADDRTKEIASFYWAINDGKFQNKPTDILKKYNLSLKELRLVISGCSYIARVLHNCNDCGKERSDQVNSQSTFKYVSVRCSDCSLKRSEDMEQFYMDQDMLADTEQQNFDEVTNDPILKTLTESEYQILKLIVTHQIKSKIYSTAFQGDPYNKSVWKIVNKLERLNLIHVGRNINGGVVSFDFDPTLIYELDNYKNLNKQSNKNSFLTTKNSRFEEIKHHDIGTFPLNDGLNLIPGEVYLYRGSIVENGSIYLKFTPVDRIDKAPSQTTIENEPKPISDIINSMFNRL